MKLPQTSSEFVKELYLSSDAMKKYGDQRFRQFLALLPKVSSAIISGGIVIAIENPRTETDFLDQELCGKILETLKPKSEIQLTHILKRTLSGWNKSVEQFPFWLKEVFGESVLIETLNNLKTEGMNPQEEDKVQTMLWWLGVKNGPVSK